jgi:ABC-type Fe3+ transport system substrate-binding protein
MPQYMDKESMHKSPGTCEHSNTSKQFVNAEDISNQEGYSPVMLALLPCGLRNAFQQTIFSAFPEYANQDNPQLIIDGNLNYEKSFHNSIDEMTSLDALPDILITSDINSLYHKEFLGYLTEENFETFTSEIHPLFKEAGYVHPKGLMMCFTTNLLVLVIDTEKLGVRQLPTSWVNILTESFSNDLTLRGDTDFFCNAMFFPYMKSVGEEAIKLLGKNTALGLHPSQMVKTINSGNVTGTTAYVMPYSFALKLRDKNRFKIVFPAEGAIVSPVQMLVKKGAYKKHQALIDFILGAEMANVLVQSGFPTSHPDVENKIPNELLNWIGWDFIETNDIRICKEKMQSLFFSEFKGGLDLLVGKHA